ncbi:glycosyltransferase family 2 protein [Flavobacterium sp. LHD-85]|uniref:glycosyltransferase family 2 protein n=1 Tax=Flavobacterium sp. LHD-85 TaxID=3071410 RepID=UPI0027DEC881|nr:glycosyltransferase family 2 protein [Flavobacterium sp. LHD-85]MDQ6530979.1 glycosyltransferase family 2 protein [Flavobacterium sp. LHD-85]
MNKECISVIIPLLNEAESLIELYNQLKNSLGKMTENYEIIFINDGSRDNSDLILDELSRNDAKVKVISFYRNNGKSAAYTVGFKAAKGDVFFTLDADLQDIPSEMNKLLNPILNGFDLAIGWKQNRINNEPLKKIPSYIYNYFKYLLFGLKLHDSNSGFRCMKREVALSLSLYGDRYRFIPEFTHLAGFKVVEIPTLHQARKFGKSKYSGARFLRGLLDLIGVRYLSYYANNPLQFFGSIALFL